MPSSAGILYIVATPIGNLRDISERAIQTLRECDLVVCEDTRVTGALLAKLGISKEMFVCEDSRERRVCPVLLEKLRGGKNVAVVSDAGTPLVSDPGFRLVRACRKEGISVVPVPGACAAMAALSASGLPCDSFLFAGFLPPKTSARRNFFEKYKNFPHTLIFYESPHRIDKFVSDALEIFGENRTVCIAKEMTKLHEAFFVGRLGDVLKALLVASLKGEFCALIAPEDFEL